MELLGNSGASCPKMAWMNISYDRWPIPFLAAAMDFMDRYKQQVKSSRLTPPAQWSPIMTDNDMCSSGKGVAAQPGRPLTHSPFRPPPKTPSQPPPQLLLCLQPRHWSNLSASPTAPSLECWSSMRATCHLASPALICSAPCTEF